MPFMTLLVILLSLPSLALAATITLQWDQSLGTTKYRLYYGLVSAHYDTILDTGPATSASVSGLADDQTYYFAATASNDAGESGYSNEVKVTPTVLPPLPPLPDTTPPTVAILNPLPGATVLRKEICIIVADAADNVGISRVDVFVDGALQCANGTVPYGCSWKVPAPPNRTYHLQARAYDLAGNVGLSPSISVMSSH